MDVSAVGSAVISVPRRKVLAQKGSGSTVAALNIGWGIIGFLGAHVLLGLIVHSSTVLSALHAVVTLGVGMYLALFDRRLERVAYVGAYIVGAEVLWHMTNAPDYIFWEFGKYSVVAIFVTAILANRLVKAPALPVFYFVLLCPSIWITIMEEDWTTRSLDFQSGRDMVSFNMSGPLALMVSAWFLSQLKLSTVQLQRLLLAILGPTVAVSTIAIFGVASSSDLSFGAHSNTTTSGGFGPNQVSSILGLGALVAFLFYILSNRVSQNQKTSVVGVLGWMRRFLMIILMIVFLAQSALTFSRGGLYNTAVGLGIAFFYLIRESRSRLQFILVAVFLLAFSGYVLLPKLDEFTGGALVDRFENTGTTGREDFMAYQMRVFERHTLFGLGPGRGFWGASHTEYTRLLSDHGLLGVAALILLFVMAAVSIKRARTILNKAVLASLVAWSFVFMAHVGMRLAAPSFLIGLSFVTLVLQDKKSLKALRKRSRRNLAYKNVSVPAVAAHNSN
jgi:hypothetical protein